MFPWKEENLPERRRYSLFRRGRCSPQLALRRGKRFPWDKRECFPERRRNFSSPGEIALRKEDKMFTRKDGFYSLQRREDIFLRGEKQFPKKGDSAPQRRQYNWLEVFPWEEEKLSQKGGKLFPWEETEFSPKRRRNSSLTKGEISLREGKYYLERRRNVLSIGEKEFPYLRRGIFLLEERNCSIKRIWSFSLRRGETSSP
jgi:hypothetical protein